MNQFIDGAFYWVILPVVRPIVMEWDGDREEMQAARRVYDRRKLKELEAKIVGPIEAPTD